MQRARFLDRPHVLAELSRIAREVLESEKDVLKILLFGSLADDTYTALSDADLIIVLDESPVRFLDRIPRFLMRFLDAPVPVDVFPYTVEEANRTEFARRALETGIPLA